MLAHLLGDASGPFFVGAASDALRNSSIEMNNNNNLTEVSGDVEATAFVSFRALSIAFHALNVLLLLSGGGFIMAARFAPPSNEEMQREEENI